MPQIAIVDPALGRTGAHNRGFAMLLAGQEAGAGEIGVWCNTSVTRELRNELVGHGMTVEPIFSVDFYRIIGKAGGVADHWDWILALAMDYQRALNGILAHWPQQPIHVIHHTMSWEHANALALAIRLLGPPGDRLSHLVFLMYSPGIDETGRVVDAERHANYRLAFRSLDVLPNTRLYASCGEYAAAYAHLMERPVALPLHPCFLGNWHTPAVARSRSKPGHERILLYVGEIKQEKGFLALPRNLERWLQASPPTRRFIIQFVEARNDAARKVLDTLLATAAKNPQVEVHHGFWPDETLHQVLASCDVLCLDYDAAAYAHKTSGLLWLAAWHRLSVVIQSGSWLEREAARLGVKMVIDPKALASSDHSTRVDETYFKAIFQPFHEWLEQQCRIGESRRTRNLPEIFRPRATPARDVVVFWKQNDSTLYGRRIDMVVRYLASRSDVRRVLVVDAPIGDANLARLNEDRGIAHHGRIVHARVLKKLTGACDTDKVAYKVFVCPLSKYRFREDGSARPRFIEGYIEFLQNVFSREGLDTERALFWVYPRNFHAPALLRKFNPAGLLVDLVDDDRAWPGVSEDTKRQLTENTRQLLAAADMALANCEPVRQSASAFFPDVRLVPNGCDIQPVQATPADSDAWRSFVSRPGKVLGFVGNLEAKIDIQLLHKLAERFNDCHIVLIGSTHANPKVLELARHANVSLPGVVPYDEVGAWLDRFDVGLIPHLNMDLTRYMNPLKTYVYLARDIPVVATAVPNIDVDSGLVRVADTHEQFLDEVAAVLAGKRPSSRQFREYAARNSWEMRLKRHVDQLMSVLR